MNSIARFVALAMFVALSMSATTGTFSSVTSYAAATSSAVLYTNGYVVSLSAAGWAYGDSVSVTGASSTSITWATPTALSGLTAVGLLLTSSAATTPCAAAPTNAAAPYNAASLVGAGTAACAADFASIYSAAPTSSTSATNFPYAATTFQLVVGTPVKFTITNPATLAAATCDGVTIQPAGQTGIAIASVACSNAAAVSQASSTATFAYYVQTATSATVCFQTDAQHTASTSCGTVVTTSSAGIMSAAISGFVAMIALIFFN